MEDGEWKIEDGGSRMEGCDALVTKARDDPRSSILDPPFGGRFWESNSNTRTPGILRITDNGYRIVATRRLIVVRRRRQPAKPL